MLPGADVGHHRRQRGVGGGALPLGEQHAPARQLAQHARLGLAAWIELARRGEQLGLEHPPRLDDLASLGQRGRAHGGGAELPAWPRGDRQHREVDLGERDERGRPRLLDRLRERAVDQVRHPRRRGLRARERAVGQREQARRIPVGDRAAERGVGGQHPDHPPDHVDEAEADRHPRLAGGGGVRGPREHGVHAGHRDRHAEPLHEGRHLVHGVALGCRTTPEGVGRSAARSRAPARS